VRTRVVVVMHQRESITSSNTGRLAVQSLEGAELRIRGGRDDRERATPRAAGGPRLALFPAPGARALGPGDASAGPVTLFVPDGNWTQARKLLRRDDELRAAEAVTIPPCGESRYKLRRNPRENGLCTLEAIAYALGVLEGPDVEASLLATLDRFVERTMRVRLVGSALTRSSE
jgi:DTW domain-containing protein YfiP